MSRLAGYLLFAAALAWLASWTASSAAASIIDARIVLASQLEQ